MKLTNIEIETIKYSIAHWKNDILPLIGKVTVWMSYPDKSAHCPLCSRYLFHGTCIDCPYRKYYGVSCDGIGSHWVKWRTDRSHDTANDMINALEKLLDDEVDDVK